EFVRTPKFRVEKADDKIEKNKYFQSTKIDDSAFVELLLAFYCFIGVAASIYFLEIAALPFQLMFFFGFASISLLSFKHTYQKNQKGKLQNAKLR
ncbi:MAG: glycosyl transferase family 2, partial [Ignavibacteria bacterium]